MEREEVDALIAKSERHLKSKNLAHPLGSWVGTLASVPVYEFFLDSSGAAIWGFGFACLSSFVSLFYRRASRQMKQARALVIWNHLVKSPKLGGQMSQATQTVEHKIRGIYGRDPQGQIFPLNQAIRLFDTHHRQQQRLSQLKHRIMELFLLKEQFAQKVAQLRQLGDDRQNAEDTLQQFDEDIALLQAMRDQIDASCQRLELLLISVEKASQIKQLNQELTGITARAAAAPMLPAHEPDDALADIERQMGREIETFLQLERETDKHLG